MDPKRVKSDRTIGTSLVNGIIHAWLADWQLGIDFPFQHVTGDLGVKRQVGGGGGGGAVVMWFKHALCIMGLVPVPGEAGGIN